MIKDLAKYNIGQLIHHRLFHYRGVVVDVDPQYQRSDEWYRLMTNSHPSKEQPWYLVLVDDTDYVTYVAEQNLERDRVEEPINHPELGHFFKRKLQDGTYVCKRRTN